MKKDNILLSPKYGVNPSMTICFYCGDVTGIALMGKLKGDVEAPKQCCTSVEPCDKCKKKYKDYCLVLEKETKESLPSGRWFAVKKDRVVPEYRNYPIVYADTEAFDSMLNFFQKEVNKNENK